MKGDPECTFPTLGSWLCWRTAPHRAHAAAISESLLTLMQPGHHPPLIPCTGTSLRALNRYRTHLENCVRPVSGGCCCPSAARHKLRRMAALEGIAQTGSAQISPQSPPHIASLPGCFFFPWHNDAKSLFPQNEAKRLAASSSEQSGSAVQWPFGNSCTWRRVFVAAPPCPCSVISPMHTKSEQPTCWQPSPLILSVLLILSNLFPICLHFLQPAQKLKLLYMEQQRGIACFYLPIASILPFPIVSMTLYSYIICDPNSSCCFSIRDPAP